jgi:serine/threonine protein kinase
MGMMSPNNNVNSIFNHTFNLPDWQEFGYAVECVLGQNLSGGRVTYRAKTESSQHVVIKQFQFATVGASWSGFAAFEQEIKLLQHLDHPRIPKYLDCFETSTGFCLVQEYINATNLAHWMLSPKPLLKRQVVDASNEVLSFSILDNAQRIAAGVLEILVYLQDRAPSIIHRDIKPENILIDEANVYLVDFGLARMHGEEMGASTTVKGTLGFMPPEQIFGRLLTTASDLYSLGATLICLLTQTPSSQIGNLIDDSFRFKIHQILPELDLHWVDWLEKMVAPNQEQRFLDAATALAALSNINKTNSIPVKKIDYKYPLAFALGCSILSLGLISASVYTAPKPLPLQVPQESIIKPGKKQHSHKHFKKAHQCFDCMYRTADLREEDMKNLELDHP